MIKVLKFKLNNVYCEDEKLELAINDSNSIARLGFAVLAAFDLLDKKPFVIDIDGLLYCVGDYSFDNMTNADSLKISDIDFENVSKVELIYNDTEKVSIVFESITVEKEEMIFNYPKIINCDDLVTGNGLKFNTDFRIKFWDLKFGYDNLKK